MYSSPDCSDNGVETPVRVAILNLDVFGTLSSVMIISFTATLLPGKLHGLAGNALRFVLLYVTPYLRLKSVEALLCKIELIHRLEFESGKWSSPKYGDSVFVELSRVCNNSSP